MAADPKLGVILACYNEAEHFLASVAEIRAVLADLHRPCEAIFMDDESRDGTRELLAAVPQSLPNVPGQGLLRERNQWSGATLTDGFRGDQRLLDLAEG